MTSSKLSNRCNATSGRRFLFCLLECLWARAKFLLNPSRRGAISINSKAYLQDKHAIAGRPATGDLIRQVLILHVRSDQIAHHVTSANPDKIQSDCKLESVPVRLFLHSVDKYDRNVYYQSRLWHLGKCACGPAVDANRALLTHRIFVRLVHVAKASARDLELL